jgi:hypothetical protein
VLIEKVLIKEGVDQKDSTRSLAMTRAFNDCPTGKSRLHSDFVSSPDSKNIPLGPLLKSTLWRRQNVRACVAAC